MDKEMVDVNLLLVDLLNALAVIICLLLTDPLLESNTLVVRRSLLAPRSVKCPFPHQFWKMPSCTL